MSSSHDQALAMAQHLLRIQAVKLSPQEPFSWASGWRSPIYCDNRKTLSHPEVRGFIRDRFAALVRDRFKEAEVIAGVATGGIAHGVLVAEDLGLPFIYVRTGAKGHGLKNQVEGDLSVGRKVVVVEDLISTGGSSLNAVDALRDAGMEVLGMTAIFTYGFDVATDAFAKAGVELHTLTNYNVLLEQALSNGTIQPAEVEKLGEWRQDPATWGQPHTQASR
jgi:orotate phosphoribosyltransferase